MCNRFCRRKIKENINKFNFKKILESGALTMLDIKIDEKQVEELLKHENCCDNCMANEEVKLKNEKLNLSKILKNIEESSVLQKIKNLKE